MEGTLLIAFRWYVVTQSLPWPRLAASLVFGHRLDSELSLRGSLRICLIRTYPSTLGYRSIVKQRLWWIAKDSPLTYLHRFHTRGLASDVLKGKAKAQWSGKHVEKSGSCCKVKYGLTEWLSGEIHSWVLCSVYTLSQLTQLAYAVTQRFVVMWHHNYLNCCRKGILGN